MGDERALAADVELPAAYVHRPRVDALLDSIAQRRVALIVAQAGAGKTVAVAGWAAAHPDLDVRWLSPGQDTRLLAGSPPTPSPIFVLDDAHLSPPVVSRLLGELLEADGVVSPRLLLLARHEPEGIPMALRLREQVAGIGYADLRFRDVEAHQLVRSLHPGIDDGRLEAIVDRSRGWAAALVLTAAPLRDYLTTEVLLPLPAPLRQVLTAVCEEPYVDGQQAAVLSGRADAADLLANAATDGFLLESTITEPDGVAVWRTQPVLADVLRRRTAPEGPDRKIVTDAHRRAADHYSRSGNARAALRHATLSGLLPLQLGALRRHAFELLARGDGRAVAAALDRIPPLIRTSFVQVQALDAIVLRSLGRYDDAKHAADAALAAAQRPGRLESAVPRSRDTEADLAIIDVWQAHCGWRDPPAARAHAARALGCARHRDSSTRQTRHAHDTRGVSLLRSASLMLDLAVLELWSGDLGSAAAHIDGAETYSRVVDLPRLSASALSLRATLELFHGSYQTAARTAATCLSQLAEHRVEGYTAAARAHLVRGLGRLQALDLDGAAEDLAAADAAPRDPFAPIVEVYRRILAAGLLMASGDAAGARQLHAQEDGISGLPGAAVRQLSLARLQAAGWMSDVPAIGAEVAPLRAAGCDLEASYAHGLALGLNGAALDAVDLFDRALGADRPSASSEPIAPPARETAATIAIARIAFLLRAGTSEAANRARHLLPEALNRLAPQRLLWVATTGQMISPAFVEHLELEASRAGGHPLAAAVVAALRRQQQEHLTVSPATATPLAREAAAALRLTPRELEVLDALAVGGSNAMIASTLYLSENTVKTHLTALYRKLGVDRRGDAVIAARRRGLV